MFRWIANPQTVKFQASEEVIWEDSLGWRLLQWHHIVATCPLLWGWHCVLGPKQWRFGCYLCFILCTLPSSQCLLDLWWLLSKLDIAHLIDHFITLSLNLFGNPLNLVLPDIWPGQFKQGGSSTIKWLTSESAMERGF